jgi:hypothetical protein
MGMASVCTGAGIGFNGDVSSSLALVGKFVSVNDGSSGEI